MANEFTTVESNETETSEFPFIVKLTESDRFSGRKPFGKVYCRTRADTQKWANDYNKHYNNKTETPDWYVIAEGE